LLALLLLLSSVTQAENTLMVRTGLTFDFAMDALQTLLQEYGYKVAHVQRCDGGLSDFGYKTDFYRVVFFGKIEEVRKLSAEYPEIVPYLPLKILLFAEDKETVLVALDPDALARYFQKNHLQVQLRRWHNDINSIFTEMRQQKMPAGYVAPAAEQQATH
jgi:uncharacterized protein (DUF302 family)